MPITMQVIGPKMPQSDAMESILRSLLVALPDDIESFRTIAGSVSIELWPALLEHAARHGVLGVLAPYLEDGLVPAPVRESLARRSAVRTMWHERLVGSLQDIVLLFDAAAVRVCALKGPALASRLYGDPTARSSVDLDLLVARHDLDRAAAALRDSGYSGEAEATSSYLLRHSHHLYFAKPAAVSIELHFQTYAGFGVAVPASALLDRAARYSFERCSVLVPSPEDELIYLAVHAAGHSFVRLLWLCDMKFLLRKNPRLDWDLIASRSRSAGIATAVGYAVDLLGRWLDLPLGDVARKFPRGGVRRAAANALLQTASSAVSRSPLDNLKGLVFTAMLCDRPASTVWLLQHHILRSARRRAQRVAPGVLPASWSG
jgi:hypothetical protein